uniref:VM domain-containing protein n=1 Tax=Anopheles farauti TaxID=69004 RepID=A0A182R163_9DIPT
MVDWGMVYRGRSMMILLLVTMSGYAGHVGNVRVAAQQQVRSARHVMTSSIVWGRLGVTLSILISLRRCDGQQENGSDSDDALHDYLREGIPVLLNQHHPQPTIIIMNSIVAAVILSIVVVGAMADYPAPAKYEAPAKGYHAPAPAYGHAPAHGGYAHHSAPVVHAYAAKAPHVKCGANLLVGCAPNVAHVPCVPAHHGGHHGGYGGHHAPAPAHHAYAAPAHHYAAPAHGYRAFSESDAFEQED